VYQQQPVEQATPVITHDGLGNIQARAEQVDGYVLSGVKTSSLRIPTQQAATITPTEAAQVAVASGMYTIGSVQVAPIPSDYFKPSGTLPITSNGTYDVAHYASTDVSVPGLVPTGTLSIGANGDYDVASYASASVNIPSIETEALTITENGVYTASSGHAYTPVTVNVSGGVGISIDDIAERKISGMIYGDASVVGHYAFYSASRITGANFPLASQIYFGAFGCCKSLTSVNFPQANFLGDQAFASCSALTGVDFPSVGTISKSAFAYCCSLVSASFPNVTTIKSSAFLNCHNLVELHIEGVSAVPTLASSVFYSTPIGGYSASAGQYGSVFVPASLYESFLTATNWSKISSRIVSV
jgi:hypothetical protein